MTAGAQVADGSFGSQASCRGEGSEMEGATHEAAKIPAADLCHGQGVAHSSVDSDRQRLDTIPIANRRTRGVHRIESMSSNEQASTTIKASVRAALPKSHVAQPWETQTGSYRQRVT